MERAKRIGATVARRRLKTYSDLIAMGVRSTEALKRAKLSYKQRETWAAKLKALPEPRAKAKAKKSAVNVAQLQRENARLRAIILALPTDILCDLLLAG